MENVIFCAMFAYKIYDKKLVQINKTIVKQSSFIHLVIAPMQFSDIFLNKQVTYERTC